MESKPLTRAERIPVTEYGTATAAGEPRASIFELIIAWVMPAGIGSESEQFANRFLASVLLTVLGAICGVVLLYPLLPLSGTGRLAYFAIMLPLLLLITALLLYFRATGNHRAVAQLLLCVLCAVLLGSAAVLGGMRSPTLIFLLCVPLLARTLLERTAAITWTAIILAGWSCLFLAESGGHRFVQMMSERANLPLVMMVALTTAVLLIYSVGETYVSTIAALHDRLAREAERQQFLAGHDELTGIANRRHFFAVSEQMLQIAGRSSGGFALLVVDLTRFKQVNDRLGHAMGDVVLVQYAQRLRDSVRGSDFVARLGGDEFSVLLDDVVDEAGLEQALRGVRTSLSQPIIIDGNELEVGAAIGAALFPQHGATVKALMHAADIAMYHSKQTASSHSVFQPGFEGSPDPA